MRRCATTRSPRHVTGVDVGQLLGVGVHLDHDLVPVGLGHEVDEHLLAEQAARPSPRRRAKWSLRTYALAGPGWTSWEASAVKIADEPTLATSTSVDEQLHSGNEGHDADDVDHQHHNERGHSGAGAQLSDSPSAEGGGGDRRNGKPPATGAVEA